MQPFDLGIFHNSKIYQTLICTKYQLHAEKATHPTPMPDHHFGNLVRDQNPLDSSQSCPFNNFLFLNLWSSLVCCLVYMALFECLGCIYLMFR